MKVFIIGAGGQGRVVYDIFSQDKNVEVAAFVDNVTREPNEKIMGIPVLGNHSAIKDLQRQGVTGAVIAVGDNHIRAAHFDKVKNMGIELVRAIHRSAHVSHNVTIGEGTVVGIGAIITTGARIGNNVIVNSGAIVEHDDVIENHVHIASGVVLAGAVIIGEKSFIGSGSIVKERVVIGRNVTVGAGSVVLEDLPDNVVAVGIPARVIKIKEENYDQKNSFDNGDNRAGWSLPGKIPTR